MSNPHTLLSEPARQAAQTLFAELGGARSVLVATADGFELTHVGQAGVDPARLAAIVGSFSALGEVASRETRIGTPRYLAIESSEGRLVVRCMQARGQSIVVVVLTDRSVTLGLVWNCLAEAERLMNAA